MTSTMDGRSATAAPATTVTVLPVTDKDRPVGAWIIDADTAVFRPVVDVTRLAGAALAAAGAITVAVAVTAVTARRRPMIGAVTMGPGGWVSVKRAGRPRLRSAEQRPWWAHLIGAHRLGD
ncbi:hypothetical protein BJY16_006318 [Actinoplanes octamycinicus]|uniref:Uncharacterized protein n=1 Tax=Actinoplanes octamycinicus TaxID=135948 RepID=A0A7W7H2Z9_9ACTN|nr:hypothetical protein [Actinoplanes octamycinicus]MBB4742859.1 hypothetical protein [Actinoplanes octamycinicus]GIE58288.1 hypothetical protein Aoc01nite_36900 [Actinoplanes octamycinicus]